MKAPAETTPSTASPSGGPLRTPVLFGLAAVTGVVDAVCYLAFGHVFTANMTGNVVLLGFAVAGVESLSVSRAVTNIRRLYRSAQLSWYAQRVEATLRRLDEDFASNHTLSGLARDIGMSPFHFARVFRELAGVPPHRYLLRHRLEVAEATLRDGASVTETCFAVGFGSLSHFVHSFRRTFGVSPSRVRSAARVRD